MDENSILTDVKAHLGITQDDESFDTILVDDINTTFMILYQLGVGPVFSISGKDSTWKDYLKDQSDLTAIRTYLYMRVRLMFDPPQNGSVLEALKSQIAELEWRLHIACDPRNTFSEESS